MLALWQTVTCGRIPVRILSVYRNADGILRASARVTADRKPYRRGEVLPEVSILFLRTRKGAPLTAGAILRALRRASDGPAAPVAYCEAIARHLVGRYVKAYASNRRAIRAVVSHIKGGYGSFKRVKRSHRRALMLATIREHAANRALYYRVTNGF